MTSLNGAVASAAAEVTGNEHLDARHFLLAFDAPEVASRARPGQFVNLTLDGRTDPLLPRPFAVFAVEGDRVEVLVKIVGRGTALLSELAPGARVGVVGPLGRGWRPVEGARAVLVAGGTGWGALRWLGVELAKSGADVRAIWGQSGEAAFPSIERVGAPGVAMILATDNGTAGFCGTGVDCLLDIYERELEGSGASAVYGAGPVPMLRALHDAASERGLACQVSLEARMACGIGVCRGCVVNATSADRKSGLRRRTVCKDGPVFDSGDIDWENLY